MIRIEGLENLERTILGEQPERDRAVGHRQAAELLGDLERVGFVKPIVEGVHVAGRDEIGHGHR